MAFSKTHTLSILIVFLHLVGLVGTIWGETQALTLYLTPINLFISFLILVYTHDPKGKTLWWLIVASILIGFFVEVLGVKTEMIFGSYIYGQTLGFKLMEVPLIIGINWFLLSYILADVTGRFSQKKWSRVLIAAALMVLMDMMIEPIAIKYDYWKWVNGEIPLQNYVGWFITGVVIQMMFVSAPNQRNPITIPLLIGQLIYFGGLHLYLFFF